MIQGESLAKRKMSLHCIVYVHEKNKKRADCIKRIGCGLSPLIFEELLA